MEALDGPPEPEYYFEEPDRAADGSEMLPATDYHTGPDLLPTEIAAEIATNDALDPRTDAGLVALIVQNSELLGEDTIGRIFNATERFNEPGNVLHTDGTITFEAFSGYRHMLERLPAYFDAATESGISQEEAEAVLTGLLTKAEFAMQRMARDIPDELTGMFEAVAAREEQITPEDLAALGHLIESYTSASSLTTGPLIMLQKAHAAGLSFMDSAALVQEHIDNNNSRQMSYGQSPLREALEVLDIADADPALVRQIFTQMANVHAEERGYTYISFAQTITIGIPGLGLTADELIGRILQDVSTGIPIHDALDNILVVHSPAITAEARGAQQEKDKAFTHKPGPLENKKLPYQTERGLNDGVRDIEQLTDGWLDTDAVAEGLWIFDPGSNAWYSYGGETTYKGDGHASHKVYLDYDVSDLSSQPINFHIHPTTYALQPFNKMCALLPSNADYRGTATILERAKGEIAMRSFISHEHGITEFTYPNDPEAIHEMDGLFREIRDRVITDVFGTFDAFEAYIRATGAERVAYEFTTEINRRMPDGFAIRLHPRDVDLEILIRPAATPEQPTT